MRYFETQWLVFDWPEPRCNALPRMTVIGRTLMSAVELPAQLSWSRGVAGREVARLLVIT